MNITDKGLEEIEKMADRVVKLHDGRIRENCRNETRMAADDLEW